MTSNWFFQTRRLTFNLRKLPSPTMGAMFAAENNAGYWVWKADAQRDAILGCPIWQHPDGSTAPIKAIGYTRSIGWADFYGSDGRVHAVVMRGKEVFIRF